MKHKVSELQGALLDAAVAKSLGLEWRVFDPKSAPLGTAGSMVYLEGGPRDGGQGGGYPLAYSPSKNWALGGPIIERERIQLQPVQKGGYFLGTQQPMDGWLARTPGAAYNERADAPLIAAMRAYVASKFGDEVDLP